MKKLTFFVFLLLLSFCLILPCFAFPVAPDFRADSYEEYKTGVKELELGDAFIPFERFGFLGEFELESFCYYGSDSCEYYLQNANGLNLTLQFNYSPFSCVIIVDAIRLTAPGRSCLVMPDNYSTLNVARTLKETGADASHIIEYYLMSNEAKYTYNTQGELTAITLYYGDNWCTIKTDFSKWEADSYIDKLLNYDTANEAAVEMVSKFYGMHQAPWEQPLTICLSAIGSAAVAAVATYLIMRKKAKNAYRLAGNGEIPASADETIAPIDENSASENTKNTP